MESAWLRRLAHVFASAQVIATHLSLASLNGLSSVRVDHLQSNLTETYLLCISILFRLGILTTVSRCHLYVLLTIYKLDIYSNDSARILDLESCGLDLVLSILGDRWRTLKRSGPTTAALTDKIERASCRERM